MRGIGRHAFPSEVNETDTVVLFFGGFFAAGLRQLFGLEPVRRRDQVSNLTDRSDV